MIFSKKICIGILGLGYIGLPLAVEFSKKFKVIGYDIDSERITELFNGKDIYYRLGWICGHTYGPILYKKRPSC